MAASPNTKIQSEESTGLLLGYHLFVLESAEEVLIVIASYCDWLHMQQSVALRIGFSI